MHMSEIWQRLCKNVGAVGMLLHLTCLGEFTTQWKCCAIYSWEFMMSESTMPNWSLCFLLMAYPTMAYFTTDVHRLNACELLVAKQMTDVQRCQQLVTKQNTTLTACSASIARIGAIGAKQ